MRDSWPPEAVGGIPAKRYSPTRHDERVPLRGEESVGEKKGSTAM